MKTILQFLAVVLFVAGCVAFLRLTLRTGQLSRQVAQLEVKLGRLPIDDPRQVYLVAIENPDVPAEVSPHIDRIWQFRCYVPPNYDFVFFSSGGTARVVDKGVYFSGGFGRSRTSPNPQACNELMTISLRDVKDGIAGFISFSGWTSGFHVDGIAAAKLRSDDLIVQTLVGPGQPARSFDPSTILPLLKIYDRSTAQVEEIHGRSVTTYAGGMMIFCPQQREADLESLRVGVMPEGFEANWIASGVEL